MNSIAINVGREELEQVLNRDTTIEKNVPGVAEKQYESKRSFEHTASFSYPESATPNVPSTMSLMEPETLLGSKYTVSKHSISGVLAPQPLKFLYEMTGPESLAEVINCYLTEAVKHVQAITTAIAQEDAVALAHAASTLESSSAFLGANSLSNLCKEFEAMAHAKSTQAGAKQLPQLKAECERVKTALQAHLKLCLSY